jgi:hypothetical protein
MRNSSLAALVASFLTLGVTPAAAQTFVKGNPNNKVVSIPLDASMAGSKIVVAVVGKTADHTNLSVALEGPAGVEVSVKSMTIRNAGAISSVYNKFGTRTKVYGQFGATAQGAAVRRAAESDRDPNCGCRTEVEISTLLSIIPGFTRQQLCSSYPPAVSCDNNGPGGGGSTGGGGGSLPGGGQSGYISAFIESNRCLAGGKPAAAIELDLARVDASNLTGVLKVKTSLTKFGGNMRAAIKPKSDGGIFPGQALLLAGPVGGTDAGVRLAKFRGERRTSLQELATPSQGGFIFYRGNSYWRRPISKYLSGGRGTFYISGQGAGYPLCVRLSRVRQNLNGYRN